MFSFFKKKENSRNPEILEYLRKIDAIDYGAFNYALRPQYSRITVMTQLYKLSECIKKTKYVLEFFNSDQEGPYPKILLERQSIALSEFVAESFSPVKSFQDQFVELFGLFKEFLTRYEQFSQMPCSSLALQNKLRFFQYYYLFIKEFTESVSNIGKI